jgi:hypothetical protein
MYAGKIFKFIEGKKVRRQTSKLVNLIFNFCQKSANGSKKVV